MSVLSGCRRLLAVIALGSLGVMCTAVSASAESLGDGQVIFGGVAQSSDPSRYDFVPDENDPIYSGVSTRSAWGQQWIGGFSVHGVTIPTILLTHDLTGSGTKIDREEAYAMSSAGRVCNYRIDFQNRYGSAIYSTVIGKLYTGCSAIGTTWGGNNVRAPYTVRTGLQCARLYSGGDFVGEQCHHIY